MVCSLFLPIYLSISLFLSITFVVEGFTSLHRCSRCILQTQLGGQLLCWYTSWHHSMDLPRHSLRIVTGLITEVSESRQFLVTITGCISVNIYYCIPYICLFYSFLALQNHNTYWILQLKYAEIVFPYLCTNSEKIKQEDSWQV